MKHQLSFVIDCKLTNHVLVLSALILLTVDGYIVKHIDR